MQALGILIGTVYALQFGEKAAAENSTFAEGEPHTVEFRNFTIFINYADNVFGISKTVPKSGNNANGYEVVFLKGYPLKPPDPRNVKFQLAKESKAGVTSMRSKRGVLHLYNMISCATGCNPFQYKGYGCYCGFLGSGRIVDGIDRCCKIHDECYEISGCQLFLQYIVPYFWKCYYNRPLCAIDHHEFGGPESCASRLCQCDKRLSECLSRFPCPKRRPVCFSSPLRAAQNILMTIVD